MLGWVTRIIRDFKHGFMDAWTPIIYLGQMEPGDVRVQCRKDGCNNKFWVRPDEIVEYPEDLVCHECIMRETSADLADC